MKRQHTLIVLLMAMLLNACTGSPDTAVQTPPTPGSLPSTAVGATPATSLSAQLPQGAACSPSLAVNSTLPTDTQIAAQPEVNCFAWQSFIALNWPASPTQRGQPDTSKTAQDFGQPDDTSLTVWQSYKAPEDVFLPGAAAPQPWNTGDEIPPPCAEIARANNAPNVKVLQMISKFDDFIPNTVQASGQILVDQDSNMVWYEKRLNEKEFDYIVGNQLYNADIQATVAMSSGIQLPVGSIELKAAWRVLEGQPSEIVSRYKTAQAILYNPSTNTCTPPTLMGLVGLHIIRKTNDMQQIMWSTFEQVDNLPGAPGATPPYSFNNPNCQSPDPCTPNATPLPTPIPPAQPTLEPVQVSRKFAISGDVQTLNSSAQQVIQQANPNSVWQYYQLIDVRWPQGSQSNLPGPKATVPISIQTFQFTSTNGSNLSNVTMETYVQQNDCLNCHVFAAVAPSAAAGCSPKLASDFSFVFDNADTADHFRSTCSAQGSAAPGHSVSSGGQPRDATGGAAPELAWQCLQCHPYQRKP
jgi:hypothetical protein